MARLKASPDPKAKLVLISVLSVISRGEDQKYLDRAVSEVTEPLPLLCGPPA